MICFTCIDGNVNSIESSVGVLTNTTSLLSLKEPSVLVTNLYRHHFLQVQANKGWCSPLPFIEGSRYAATATRMSTTSMHPGQTSRQASRISELSFGWFCSKSTGLAAKQTMTALTELLMIPNKTLETTNPTNAPALEYGLKQHNL
jgi:hypothetical protein